jgi:multiple sugar transport system permease protein
MATTARTTRGGRGVAEADVRRPSRTPRGEPRWPRLVSLALLLLGALAFLFPFYYMIVGSLQKRADTDISGALPNVGSWTFHNYSQINDAIDLPRTLLNSGIFTGGVILLTLIGGLLAGYALAQLEFGGRAVVFYTLLLTLIVPFMLLMIPLYVMIVRWYGLSDSYLGMIVPFAINPTAVFIFRQFFKQIPTSLFESARVDGASELSIMLRVAVPLARPAILTAIVITFIGPWNEFLWPFLVTKQQDMQPLAVALGNYMNNVAARAANPFGAMLAGATVLAVPAVLLTLFFQRYLTQSNLGSGVKG